MKLIHGDCIDVTEPVDLIVTSPPYANQRKKQYGGVSPDKYADWFLPRSKVFYDQLKDTGSMVVNIKENVVDGQRSLYVYKMVIEMVESQGWRLVDDYCWHKSTAMPGKWNGRFRDQWEHCYHFAKQKGFTFNQDVVMVPRGDWANTRMKNLSDTDKSRHNSDTASGFGRNVSAWNDRELVYPSNVLYGSPETKNQGHPAVYPVWLPEFFIKLLSNEGDLVYDPFVGSGTTMLAAHNLGRDSLGVDSSDESIATAKKRLAELL